MYALVATLSAWSLYCFLRGLESPRLSWWVAYVFLTVGSLYSHLYATFLLPAEVLFLFLYLSQYRKALWRAVAAWVVSLVCFSPWLLAAWRLSGVTRSWRPSVTLPAMLWSCLEAFTVRRVPLPPVQLGVILAACGILVLVGLSLPYVPERASRAGRRMRLETRPTVFLILTLLIPVLLAYALSFRYQIFGVYYLIVAVAPFLLTLVAGLDKIRLLSKWAELVLLLTVIGVFCYGLRYNWALECRKEEWRAAAQYIAERATDGDAILCHVNYTHIPFTYYYRGALPLFAPFGGPPMGWHDVAQSLEGLDNYNTVWLVQSHTEQVDPGRTVEAWLSSQFPVVTEQYPPGVEVKAFAANYRLGRVPSDAHLVGAEYGGKIRLEAYQMDAGPFSATDDTYHPPSGWIHVTLYWQAIVPLSEDYVAAVRLIDDAHRVWGGQLDRPTSAMRFYRPSAWQVDEVVRDDYDVNLNPRTPEGTYEVEVSLFTPSGEQLPVGFGGRQEDAVNLRRVSIVSP